jgi:hypothetical protein
MLIFAADSSGDESSDSFGPGAPAQNVTDC